MAVFDDFWARLNFEIIELVLHDWWDYRDAAAADGKDFLEKIRPKVARWCMLLENGTHSREDFRWLLAGTKEQADLTRLKQRGIPKAEQDRFAYGVINITAHTAFVFYAPEAPFKDANQTSGQQRKHRKPGEEKKRE
jgi:hypothetical protein